MKTLDEMILAAEKLAVKFGHQMWIYRIGTLLYCDVAIPSGAILEARVFGFNDYIIEN